MGPRAIECHRVLIESALTDGLDDLDVHASASPLAIAAASSSNSEHRHGVTLAGLHSGFASSHIFLYAANFKTVVSLSVGTIEAGDRLARSLKD